MSLAAENVGEAYIFNIAFHWSHMYITDSSNVRMWPHDSHIHADSSPEARVQFEMSPRPGYSSRGIAAFGYVLLFRIIFLLTKLRLFVVCQNWKIPRSSALVELTVLESSNLAHIIVVIIGRSWDTLHIICILMAVGVAYMYKHAMSLAAENVGEA